MIATLLLQLLLPLGLLAQLAIARPRGAVDLALRAGATACVLAALRLAALWVLLPLSLVGCYAAIWLVVVAARSWRLAVRPAAANGRSAPGWPRRLVFSSLAALGLYVSAVALLGRRPPDVESVDIPLPFLEGRFLVANGGSTELVNPHMKTLDRTVPRFQAFRGQSYAIDLIRVNRWGVRAEGLLPRAPERYLSFGTPVHAPCDGVVLAARGDRPDMPVPVMDLEVFEGNHVLLDCGDFELLLAHFQQGTVTVRTGDAVWAGQLLGRIGNSGRTGEPHLHCNAQRPGPPGSPYGGKPLFLTFNGRVPVRNSLLLPSSP